MSISAIFNQVFETAQDLKGDIDLYHNGTGHFNDLVSMDFGLKVGQVAKATDHHGRKVLIIKTPLENVVVFQRHAGNSERFVANMHPALSEISVSFTDLLSEGSMMNLVGGPGTINIGERFALLLHSVDLRRNAAARKAAVA